MQESDLTVEKTSDALSGLRLDVVVTGSIGAVESVRFIRALRRLGAFVTPWLTEGGASLVTPMSLSWAANQQTIEKFSGDASHIAIRDACVVAPASADFIGRVACGLADYPAAALVMSYLGQKKPVILLPNMHDSLLNSPKVQENIETLKRWGIFVLKGRIEEGKCKFPHPAVLADEVAHIVNKPRVMSRLRTKTDASSVVLINMGGTRAYIDDVRYIGNYSSGKLGSLISEELFRSGFDTYVVASAADEFPRVSSKLIKVVTNDDMESALKDILASQPIAAAVLAAAVLDFVPSEKKSGKIKSKDTETGHNIEMSLKLIATKKIIKDVNIKSGIKVGFKLEAELNEEKARNLAQRYLKEYNLSFLVANSIYEVGPTNHKAFLCERSVQEIKQAFSKTEIANAIVDHIKRSLFEVTH